MRKFRLYDRKEGRKETNTIIKQTSFANNLVVCVDKTATNCLWDSAYKYVERTVIDSC